jgi:DNA-binding CsgD family transcriptional regulator
MPVIVAADQLTAREGEVLDLLAQGLSNHEIAVVLVVSDRTVSAHLSQVYDKLDAHTRGAAIIRAQELGLVPSGGELHPIAAAIIVLARLRPSALAEAEAAIAGEGGR